VKARYDLGDGIAGFDFFQWLVMAQALGATEVVFDTRTVKTTKWPEKTVRRRFESILLPGPALAGMPASIGTEGERVCGVHFRELVAWWLAGGRFKRLQSVLPPGRARYTVTLRKTDRHPTRNANEADWRAFAKEIGAVVIEDYDVKPIHLHERMALYAGAEMNFFTNNGPAILCLLSEYPAMLFDCGVMSNQLRKCGIEYGNPPPFCLPQHRLIFESGELANLRRHFDAWRNDAAQA